MANEATKLYDESSGDGSVVQDYAVSDGASILKGSILKLTDERTAAQSDGAGDVIAGIAKREKVANDGRTRLSVYKKGYFDVYASGAITLGAPVQSAGHDNYVQAATSLSGAVVMGYSEATAGDGEKFTLRLDL